MWVVARKLSPDMTRVEFEGEWEATRRRWLEAIGTVWKEMMSAIEWDHTEPGGVWHWAQEGKDRWLRGGLTRS